MSLRLEMLQVTRLAPRLLGDSVPLVREFFLRQQNEDGGFKDRSGASDLYYTVFGLDGLMALETVPGEPDPKGGPAGAVERAQEYLRAFGDGSALDFVHLCCLARAWAGASGISKQTFPPAAASSIMQRLGEFRTPDGGFNPARGALTGTAYGAFLGLGAAQDLRMDLPFRERLGHSLDSLRTADGVWTNEGIPAAGAPPRGSTNATAAIVSVCRHLGIAVDHSVGRWLLDQAHPQGGFRAAPGAPIPDLLSTATALHALAGLEIRMEPAFRERCLDFVDSLWSNAGGFHGHWSDDHLDCEYTFYGLLALGHLAV